MIPTLLEEKTTTKNHGPPQSGYCRLPAAGVTAERPARSSKDRGRPAAPPRVGSVAPCFLLSSLKTDLRAGLQFKLRHFIFTAVFICQSINTRILFL